MHWPTESGVDVVAEDIPETKTDDRGKRNSFLREFPIFVVVALGLALLIKSFVAQAFYIPSGSMENTLLINDRVLVNRLVYHVREIARGDIVVFSGVDSWDIEVPYQEPSNPIAKAFHWVGTEFGMAPSETDYIKRVIGIPGDTVKCCDSTGRITVNGTPLDEKAYLYPGDEPSTQTFEVTVPENQLWVMGDHRSLSSDSRFHTDDPGGGSIPMDKVIGRAFVIAWPFDRAKILPIPDTFTQPALDVAAGIVSSPLLAGSLGTVPLVLWRRYRAGRRSK
ncbi:signal peptidase I [Microbispora sp. RL4-1S]|uniref:Signal peptidase I n=1 Tax=Microbispora oryzae TaxID=2806554 RepID=A0A941ARC0_9ACTN|nr:signal peptidase I [Microbispora oryzae]MBP2705824.1 signal peptidase I [Microbispora oryzae]